MACEDGYGCVYPAHWDNYGACTNSTGNHTASGNDTTSAPGNYSNYTHSCVSPADWDSAYGCCYDYGAMSCVVGTTTAAPGNSTASGNDTTAAPGNYTSSCTSPAHWDSSYGCCYDHGSMSCVGSNYTTTAGGPGSNYTTVTPGNYTAAAAGNSTENSCVSPAHWDSAYGCCYDHGAMGCVATAAPPTNYTTAAAANSCVSPAYWDSFYECCYEAASMSCVAGTTPSATTTTPSCVEQYCVSSSPTTWPGLYWTPELGATPHARATVLDACFNTSIAHDNSTASESSHGSSPNQTDVSTAMCCSAGVFEILHCLSGVTGSCAHSNHAVDVAMRGGIETLCKVRATEFEERASVGLELGLDVQVGNRRNSATGEE